MPTQNGTPKQRTGKLKSLTVRITDENKDELIRIAAEDERSIQWVLSKWIEEKLEEHRTSLMQEAA